MNIDKIHARGWYRFLVPVFLGALVAARIAAQPVQWQFDGDAVGSPPKGATVFTGMWQVQAVPDAPSKPNVLVQNGRASFPALVLGDGAYADSDISVRFKAISGQEDQAAGIIFRVQDKDNYYIIRANALEGSVNLYVYQRGQRNVLKEGRAGVKSGQWQTLRVAVRGPAMKGYLDGQLVVETTDKRFASGKSGLWTKADSLTWFDNFQVTPLAGGE